MPATIELPLAAWEPFYLIVGTSAGALTGLQFVVMALVAQAGARRTSPTVAAFGTPTVVHFCAVVLVSGIVTAPWPSIGGAAAAVAGAGLAGLIYAAVVIRRARRQRDYRPVFEDWLWHTALPSVAYGALTVAGFFIPRSPTPALFTIGVAALLLFFIGIHNAWDTVTYVLVDQGQAPSEWPGTAPTSEPRAAQASPPRSN